MNNRTTPEVREQIALAISAAGTQQALADILGVTQQAVSAWLNGNRWLALNHANTIERLFGIPAAGMIKPVKGLSS